MRLLSHDGRVLRGEEGLRVYRMLFPLAPRVYGSRLAYVLIEASRRAAFAGLPERRRALLAEAVAAARALDEGQPYRAKMLDRALRDLALLDAAEGQGSTAAAAAVGRAVRHVAEPERNGVRSSR